MKNVNTVILINSLRQTGENMCNIHFSLRQRGSVSWGDEEMVSVCWYVCVCVGGGCIGPCQTAKSAAFI